MRRVLFILMCLAIWEACTTKPQHVQDQTEAINDSTDKESEEIAEENFEASAEDTLSAKN